MREGLGVLTEVVLNVPLYVLFSLSTLKSHFEMVVTDIVSNLGTIIVFSGRTLGNVKIYHEERSV